VSETSEPLPGPSPEAPDLPGAVRAPSSGLAETRVDKWAWAVRLYKTRSAATDACRAGHVKVNQVGAKPSSTVKVGDTVQARTPGRDVIVEVAAVIEKRVGAPVAAACYVDHTPPPSTGPGHASGGFVRDRGAGRPTKRDRRQMDRARRT
jgi:ribosome-associated heat shock protein Hsp15